ncbi:hypothetical protein RAJCM14343_5743 [Rhodococcus aetherivorans]|uniref:Uncharacterized protein n=1 Tax=Rhodococcus aetherivorans TaxID=191292 RepID=A0ABQ0YVP8_9NOCA|nr:hypothetical protein RAJCM14343_5743 [Rhodococcus aetherivorans]
MPAVLRPHIRSGTLACGVRRVPIFTPIMFYPRPLVTGSARGLG